MIFTFTDVHTAWVGYVQLLNVQTAHLVWLHGGNNFVTSTEYCLAHVHAQSRFDYSHSLPRTWRSARTGSKLLIAQTRRQEKIGSQMRIQGYAPNILKMDSLLPNIQIQQRILAMIWVKDDNQGHLLDDDHCQRRQQSVCLPAQVMLFKMEELPC